MSGRKRAKLTGLIERWRVKVAPALVVVMALTGGCFLDHDVEQFYGRAVAPRAQEFRWSDGGLPQVFDPALAAAAPDTDAVRALYEGLTEYDPKTLAPVPGVAARWEASADARVWTFHLRRDARWSNNDAVTAHDFVRSWQRTIELGDRAPHARLLKNIEGVAQAVVYPSPSPTPEPQPSAPRDPSRKEEPKRATQPEAQPKPAPFGAEALDDYTLRVRLQRPDPGFPALASHPVFRPVHKLDSLSAEANPAANPAPVRPVSNGAFQLTKVGADGVVLERAKNYWDAGAVSLQRVQFVPAKDAEAALAAYHAGEVDAVTNAGFEPLALKLLTPYKDFRRATFGALTYYSFNTARPPFDDMRVREALTIAIDRDRISQDELGGATEPAKRFLPGEMPAGAADRQPVRPIERDVERARSLLAEAGYPLGQNFPKIRLLVNRNAQQRQVAEAIAAMWRNALGVETEIILKDWVEYEIAFREGDYDVARRSYVMQAADESASLRAMFEPETPPVIMLTAQGIEQTAQKRAEADKEGGADEGGEGAAEPPAPSVPAPLPVLSEAQALRELPAMPIYFASSYALVKPYVVGFDSNLLDAPSLKHVRIDTSWQQPKQAGFAWFK